MRSLPPPTARADRGEASCFAVLWLLKLRSVWRHPSPPNDEALIQFTEIVPMRRALALPALTLLLVCMSVQPALANPNTTGGWAFADGWWHPLVGLDHLLAMVAVGLLAVRIGGRALWLMPCSFLGCMMLGGLAASWGMPLPGVEWGILASVLVLGLLIAATSVVSMPLGAGLVGLFAAFHGHAHAEEMVAGGSFGAYAAGFLLSTALLHLSGVGVGVLLARNANVTALRAAGGAITAASLLLILGIL